MEVFSVGRRFCLFFAFPNTPTNHAVHLRSYVPSLHPRYLQLRLFAQRGTELQTEPPAQKVHNSSRRCCLPGDKGTPGSGRGNSKDIPVPGNRQPLSVARLRAERLRQKPFCQPWTPPGGHCQLGRQGLALRTWNVPQASCFSNLARELEVVQPLPKNQVMWVRRSFGV